MANRRLLHVGLILVTAISGTFLTIAENKVSEVIELSPPESIALLVAAFVLNFYLLVRLTNVGADSAAMPEKAFSGPKFLRLPPQVVFSAIAGAGGLLGGLIWLFAGIVGFYAVLPIVLLLLFLLLKTPFARKDQVLSEALLLSALLCLAVYALYLCIAILIIAHQGGVVHKNGNVVIPLMWTSNGLSGLLLAVLSGVIGTCVAFFWPTRPGASVPPGSIPTQLPPPG
jgi:hypothetical protein